MKLNIPTVLKWVAALDGAVVSAAMVFGKAMPQYAAITDTIVGVGAGITSVLGVAAKLYGWQASGGGPVPVSK